MPGPDPASALWDAAAARFLAAVIAAGGDWYARPVLDPAPAQAAWLASIGYDPSGPDNKTGHGSLNARDAWRRAFIRAVYRANDPRYGGPGRHVQLEVGRRLPELGTVRPRPGRPVRGRTRRGGGELARAVARKQQWAGGGPGQAREWQP
jgi:hypothetical protein